MSVYNGADYLAQAIDSILQQTFTDFEFIIVDDASTDDTLKVLKRYSDARIQLLQNDTNLGMTKSWNRGLEIARGEFIARQDADDISLPDRFSKQISHMEQNPEIVLCGTFYEVVGSNGESMETYRLPVHDSAIRWQMLFHNSFAHTSVIFRLDTVRKNQLSYPDAYLVAADYRLWSRLLQQGKVINLPYVLVKYRRHSIQITETMAAKKQSEADEISSTNLSSIGCNLELSDVSKLREVYYQIFGNDIQQDIRVAGLFLHILRRFCQQPGLDREILQELKRNYTKRAIKVMPFKQLNKRGAVGLLMNALRTDPITAFSLISNRVKRMGI